MSTTQKIVNITYKIDTGGNLILFKVFTILLTKSTLATLHVTKNSSFVLKTFNQLDITQLCMHIAKLRYKDKGAKCRFFLVPGDGPELLGMPDIELLNILRITCAVISGPHESRKLDSEAIEVSNSSSCIANRTQQMKTDKVGICDNNTNMADYFRSRTSKAADSTICRQVNLKLNRNKYLFICTSIPFMGEIISQQV